MELKIICDKYEARNNYFPVRNDYNFCLVSSDAPLELPSFQLTPSQGQVVFQGDSLPFQCQASFVAEDMQVQWYQNGRMVKPDAAQGIFIEKRMVQNCSLIARYGGVHSCSC